MLKKTLLSCVLAISIYSVDFNASGPLYNGEWTVGSNWSGNNAPLSGSIANFPSAANNWYPYVDNIGAVAALVTINGTTSLSGAQILNLFPASQIAIEVNKPFTVEQNPTIKFNSSGTIQVNATMQFGNSVQQAKIVGSVVPVDLLITGNSLFQIAPNSSINDPASSQDAFSNIIFKDALTVDCQALSSVGSLLGTAHGTITIENASITNSGRFLALSGTSNGTCVFSLGTVVNNLHFIPISQAAQGNFQMNSGYFQNMKYVGVLQNYGQANFNLAGGFFYNGDEALSFYDYSSGTVEFSGVNLTNQGDLIVFKPNSFSSATITVSDGIINNQPTHNFVILDQNNRASFYLTGGEITNNGTFAFIGTSSSMDIHLDGGTFNNLSQDKSFCLKDLSSGSITLDGGFLLVGTSSSFGVLQGTSSYCDALIKSGKLDLQEYSTFLYSTGTNSALSLEIQGGETTVPQLAQCFLSSAPFNFFNISSGTVINSGDFGYIKNGGNLTGTFSGGTIENSANLIKFENNATGLIVISGGSISNNANSRFVTASGTCQLNSSFSGGTVINNGLYYYLNTSNGDFTFDGIDFSNQGSFGELYVSSSSPIHVLNSSISNSNNSSYILAYNSSHVDVAFGTSSFINNGRTMFLFGGSKGTVNFSQSTITNHDRMILTSVEPLDCYITMASGSVTNYSIMMQGGPNLPFLGTFSMMSGSVYNLGTQAYLAERLKDVSLQGGYIENDSGIFADNTQNQMLMADGAMIKNISTLGTTGVIGPCPLMMSGGTIENDGYLSVTDTSDLSFGTLFGTGTLLITGTINLGTTISQDLIICGVKALGHQIGDTLYNTEVTANSVINSDLLNKRSSDFHLNGTLNGSVTNYGIFIGKGTVQGTFTNYQSLKTGGIDNPDDALKMINYDMEFVGPATYEMSFAASSTDQIKMINGNIIITPQNGSNPTIEATPTEYFTPYTEYKIISFDVTGLKDSGLGGITGGSFNLSFTLPQVKGTLISRPDGLYLVPYYGSLVDIASTPNQKQVAQAIDTLNGNTNPCLQSKIDQIFLQNDQVAQSILTTLEPSEFKGQQVVYEEMSFLINHELNSRLYDFHKGYRPFLIAGYENINQKSYFQYAGYSSNNGYQLLGFSYGFTDVQTNFALGALESSTDYKTMKAHSSSGSVLANFGISYFKNHFSCGLDALFGYHFIHTSRIIDFFDSKALSDHGGYSIKAQAHLDYKKTWTHVSLTPYENFGYYNGHENHFKEHGASCLNLQVKTPSRNLLRNELGAKVVTRLQKSKKRHIHVMPYVDAAWVYEHRFHGKYYKTQFENTAPIMEIQGLGVTRNFGRVDLGLIGVSKSVELTLNFDGMWGKRISELGASFSLDKRF